METGSFWRHLAFLQTPPPPLSRRERLILLWVTVAVAITRWFALSRTIWDWDEALFMLGVRDFDVTQHHPHPPGFPLFIATAKLLHHAGLSEFHSLQALNLIAAIAIVPATLFLARELRMSFEPALFSGVLLAFFPNVWLFGGTAFSDVPAMTLVMVAVTLLLRGCRSFESFLAGAVVLGIAAGYRPQNLLIGLVPSALAAFLQMRQHWLRPLLALVLIVSIIVAAFGVAAALSNGWESYRSTVKSHSEYIAKVDSFRSPTRPSLPRLFDDFFIRPYHVAVLNGIIALFILFSLARCFVRPAPAVIMTILIFGPMSIVAWLILDWLSVSRFSIGYIPMMAILAADGMSHLGRIGARVAVGLCVLIAIVWMTPVLLDLHRNPSPPAAAADWIRANVPRSVSLYVHGSMHPLTQALLPDYPQEEVSGDGPPASVTGNQHSVYIREGVIPGIDVHVFSRSRKRTVEVVRGRYFQTSVAPVTGVVDFREGWHDPEGAGTVVFRWMKQRGVVMLPPISGDARLTFRLFIPLDVLPKPPTITVTLAGAQIDQFPATSPEIAREYVVKAKSDGPNELVIFTDRTINPAAAGKGGDSRDLGVRLDGLGWMPVR